MYNNNKAAHKVTRGEKCRLTREVRKSGRGRVIELMMADRWWVIEEGELAGLSWDEKNK